MCVNREVNKKEETGGRISGGGRISRRGRIRRQAGGFLVGVRNLPVSALVRY